MWHGRCKLPAGLKLLQTALQTTAFQLSPLRTSQGHPLLPAL